MKSNREAAAVADRQTVHRQDCTSIRAVNCLTILRGKKDNYIVEKKEAREERKRAVDVQLEVKGLK